MCVCVATTFAAFSTMTFLYLKFSLRPLVLQYSSHPHFCQVGHSNTALVLLGRELNSCLHSYNSAGKKTKHNS